MEDSVDMIDKNLQGVSLKGTGEGDPQLGGNDVEMGVTKSSDTGAELEGNGLDNEPEMMRLATGGVLLYYFTPDVEAQSEDPKALEEHYQFPLNCWVKNARVLTGAHRDPLDKLIISQSFMNLLASKNDIIREHLKDWEQFKGRPGSMQGFKRVVPIPLIDNGQSHDATYLELKKLKVLQNKPKLKAKDRAKDEGLL